MKFQRLLILVFAAALTAGTCAATPVLFNLNVGTGNQSVSLSIDGSPVNSIYGPGSVFTASPDLEQGWHNIVIDYESISGTNYLALGVNNNGSPLLGYLGSYNASGTTINGLTGDYFVGGVHQFTKYREGPIRDGSVGGTEYYNNAPGLWAGIYDTTSSFEEKLSGYIYVGGGTPSLSDIPPSGGGTGGGGGGGDAPEPAGWWLAAAALPFMLFSRLRLRHARTSH